MAMVGKAPLPWQRDVLRGAMGIGPDGKWAAYEVAVWVARQNGKGVITEAQELFGAFMLREQQIVHSAHLFDTSQKAFNRTVEIIEGSDWLTKRVAKIVRGKGSEAINLTRAAGGGAIEFKARTLHGARGLTGNRVTLDEAYALTVGHYQAMSPIMATIPNPQITYTSSPPDDKTGMMPEDALAPSIRARGLAGDDPGLASFEWSPPEQFDMTDVDLWYACNPSLGLLIDEGFLHRQLRVFQSSPRPSAFATEHLGLWPDSVGAQWGVIPKADWLAAEDLESEALDPVGLAVTLSTDRRWATITAAGRRPDGMFHLEVVDRREGTGWVIPRLKGLRDRWQPCAVVVNRSSPAESLGIEAEEAGIELTPINAQQQAAACGALIDGIAGRPAPDPDTGQMGRDPRVIRYRPTTPDLTTAAAGARTRKSGDTRTWDPVEAAVDITPIIGCSNALWGYMTRQPEQPFFGGWR